MATCSRRHSRRQRTGHAFPDVGDVDDYDRLCTPRPMQSNSDRCWMKEKKEEEIVFMAMVAMVAAKGLATATIMAVATGSVTNVAMGSRRHLRLPPCPLPSSAGSARGHLASREIRGGQTHHRTKPSNPPWGS